jgi:hypothetical protein
MLSAIILLAIAQRPDDCALEFKGHSKRSVKLRTGADGASYELWKGGEAMTLDEWFAHTCGRRFNERVPSEVDDGPDAKAIAGVETARVKVKGWLLAARFEKHEDHDLHIEIGAEPKWETDHLIVEIPPGPEYCAARTTLWALVKRDRASPRHDSKVLARPVSITVEGFVFLDYSHKHQSPCTNRWSKNWCDRNAGRGIHYPSPDSPSRVRGCFEIHPVLSVVEG